MPAIEALRHRIAELRLCKKKIVDAQNCLFDLRLMDEMESIRAVLGKIDDRIDDLELILHRHQKKDSQDSQE